MKNNFVVYTALFGDYDNLIDPKENYEGCDFVCFTDQEHLKSEIWEIRLVKDCDLSSNMMNRRYKLLPHLFLPEYEYSLYVDANIGIAATPLDLLEKYLLNNNLVLPKHFLRDCLYEESKECIIIGKSSFFSTVKQVYTYKHEGFPQHFGLSENNIILRKHNEIAIVKIMTNWWKECNEKTQRDQLSLGYVLWKEHINFYFMDESSRNNNIYFYLNKHKKLSRKSLFQFLRENFFKILIYNIKLYKLFGCK